MRSSRTGGPPELLREQGRSPFVIQAPDDGNTVLPKPVKKTIKPEPVKSTIVGRVKSGENLPPLPLTGNVPKLDSPLPATVVEPTQLTGDLHSEEAQVRAIAAKYGGSVVSVRDAKGAGLDARTIEISTAPQQALALSAKIRSTLGQVAMVETPKAAAADQAGSVDLQSAQKELESLKAKLHQAELDFYPDAPALRSLQGQYADQAQRVRSLRSSLHLPVLVTVVITGGG